MESINNVRETNLTLSESINMLNITPKELRNQETVRVFIKSTNIEFLNSLADKHSITESDCLRQLIQSFKNYDLSSYSYIKEPEGEIKNHYLKNENVRILDDIKQRFDLSRPTIINIILELAQIEESKK